MKSKELPRLCILSLIILTAALQATAMTQASADEQLDTRVRTFLDSRRNTWHDLNVPEVDGQTLHDIIVKNNYTRALEIGTSTGRSGIWIAWALSKTGGKLITIEIDPQRHREALANFEAAGLSDYIDARLADAHQLVKELEGPFDFVFSDADKGWYTNYFLDVDPKLVVGGCFTAHNVSRLSRTGAGAFLAHIQGMDNYETTVERRGGGLSISYKRAEQ